MSRLRPAPPHAGQLAPPPSPTPCRWRRGGTRESCPVAPELPSASASPGLARHEAASCDRGVVKGSSRMKGNFHVRFLGEEAAVMPVSLPDLCYSGVSLNDVGSRPYFRRSR